jgi:hypothetical protein
VRHVGQHGVADDVDPFAKPAFGDGVHGGRDARRVDTVLLQDPA